MKVLIPIFVLTFINNIVTQVTACPKPNDIRHHLGARTAYRFKSNKNDTRITYPGCKDLKSWMIIRHGTRLPKTRDIYATQNLTIQRDEILSQHKKAKGQLTKKQLKQLEDWTLNVDIDKEKFLTMEGQEEMVLLAERMQKRFPNVIREKYNNKSFLFRHTATQRALMSARSFTNGLFETKDAQTVVFAPVTKVDKVLRFYKHCDRWQKQIKENPETYKEQQLYGISQEMNETLKSVSKRLGLNTVLTLETANVMYKTCGYETAWSKHYISPWCYAFDKKTIQVFEYYHDLKSYWLDGYGFELTYQQACITIKHMFDTFSKNLSEGSLRAIIMRIWKWTRDIISFSHWKKNQVIKRNDESPQATFLFTHSGTILKTLTYLGLYKPKTHLTATKAEDRKWRMSEIDSFAANLAFVLFKCDSGDHVLTLHQEKIIRLPMCSEDLCPLKTLQKYFHRSIKNCNFEEMCNLDVNDAETNDNTTFKNMTKKKNIGEL